MKKSPYAELLELGERAAAFDHVEPFNEASRLAMQAGDEPRVDVRLTTPDGLVVAAAYAPGDAPVEAVVSPPFRRGGLGRRLLETVLKDGETELWAHGDTVGAQRLSRRLRLAKTRELLVLARPAADPLPAERPVDGVTLRTFTPDDTDAVVRVNARAFAHHPEQGAMDRADFERRAASAWFDPAGLFVAERDGEVVGFHWTKVEAGSGEVYVVGVDPDAQGGGLGRALTLRGLHHLAATGVDEVELYVEGDNAPALAVYRGLGFTDRAQDVLYARRP